MLPRALCQLSVLPLDGAWEVNYLTERDHAWLAALIAEYARGHGIRQSELKERLAEPLPVRAPKGKRRVVEHLLDRLCRAPLVAALPPREARQLVFSLAARQDRHRAAVLGEAAAVMHVDTLALEAALLADLESERRVGDLPPRLTPDALAQHTNLTIVESLLGRARELRIVAPDHTQTLVRYARSSGLLCVVEKPVVEKPVRAQGGPPSWPSSPSSPSSPPRLRISGPFSLFRQTRVYARALTSLVRRTLSAPDFDISADCQLSARGDPIRLCVRGGDPLPLSGVPVPAESSAERAFARDFPRLTRDWELVRDPEPVTTGSQLLFADFEIRHRAQRAPSCLVEVVGFWTRAYLVEKLARLNAAGIDRVLLCVDTARCCSAEELPESPQLLPFRRRVDAAAVIKRLEGCLG